MKKHLAVFALTMLVLGSVATYASPAAFADWLIDRSGTLVKIDPRVLGDETNTTTESPAPSATTTPVTSALREQEQKKSEQNQELAKQRLETETKARLQRKSNTEQTTHTIKSSDGLQVTTETKNATGTTLRRKETKIGDEPLHIEQPSGTLEINAVKNGELEISRAQLKAHTELPISVNSNNELVVTKPDGTTKTVTVLPDQAIAKMIEKGLLSAAPNKTESENNVELSTNTSGDPVYIVKHEDEKKFLGLFKMKFQATSEVSATDPESVNTTTGETAPWRKLLERFSL